MLRGVAAVARYVKPEGLPHDVDEEVPKALACDGQSVFGLGEQHANEERRLLLGRKLLILEQLYDQDAVAC